MVSLVLTDGVTAIARYMVTAVRNNPAFLPLQQLLPACQWDDNWTCTAGSQLVRRAHSGSLSASIKYPMLLVPVTQQAPRLLRRYLPLFWYLSVRHPVHIIFQRQQQRVELCWVLLSTEWNVWWLTRFFLPGADGWLVWQPLHDVHMATAVRIIRAFGPPHVLLVQLVGRCPATYPVLPLNVQYY